MGRLLSVKTLRPCRKDLLHLSMETARIAPVYEIPIARPQKHGLYVVLHGTGVDYGRLRSKYEYEFCKDIKVTSVLGWIRHSGCLAGGHGTAVECTTRNHDGDALRRRGGSDRGYWSQSIRNAIEHGYWRQPNLCHRRNRPVPLQRHAAVRVYPHHQGGRLQRVQAVRNCAQCR